MKKQNILMIVVFTLLFINSKGQSWGIMAGSNFSNLLVKIDNQIPNDYYNFKPGIHVGIDANIPVSRFISLEPSLILSEKGNDFHYQETNYTLNSRLSLYYLDIPIYANLFYDIGHKRKIYVLIGPYLEIGLKGKIKREEIESGETHTEIIDLDWGYNKYQDYVNINRLGVGLSFGAGFEKKSFFIGISYDLGISNNSAYLKEDNFSIKNRVIKLSLGKKFKINTIRYY
ncbi:MAG: PorT family protein [Epsilonproteobacteria bacterium]|nr:PorT family protein [Campylobacterota bacterium]